jgi:hypothetical protein
MSKQLETLHLKKVFGQYEKIFTDDYKTISPEYKDFLMKFTNRIC